MGEYLSYQILVHMRDFIIKCKIIFTKAIIWFGKKYPEPTKENTLEPNSHILLDIEDKFFQYYDCPQTYQEEMWKAAWKILICEYEHDPHYRHIFDWFIEELVESVISGQWKPRPSRHPSGLWKEPNLYGDYIGRNFKQYIKNK